MISSELHSKGTRPHSGRWVDAVIRVTAAAVLLITAGVTARVWGPYTALLVLGLGGLASRSTAAGAAALFLVATPQLLDVPRPLVGGATIHFWEVALGAVLSGVVAARGRRLDTRPLWWGLPLVVALLASTIDNLKAYQTLPHVLRGATPVWALFLGWNAARESRGDGWIRMAIGAAVVVYGGAALVQFALAPGRVNWPFYIATHLGSYTVLLIPFTLLWVLTRRGDGARAWGAATLVLIVALVLSLTRGAWLSAVVAVAVAWFLTGPSGSGTIRLRRAVAGLIVVGLIVPLVALLLAAPPDAHLRADSTTRLYPVAAWRHFADLRLPMLQLGARMWADHPLLGVGPGQYGRRVLEYEEPIMAPDSPLRRYPEELARTTHRAHVHMAYLQIAVEIGALGLLSYLFLVAAVGRALWRGRTRVWGRAGLAALVGLLTYNFLGYSLSALAPEWGVLLGAAAWLGQASGPGERPDDLEERGAAGEP